MKGVMSHVPPDILAWRKRTGADRWDEMWEGVLHMVPSPNFDHQNFEWALETWLRLHWATRCHGLVGHQINVARPGCWNHDFRIPDLVLLSPERASINKNEYFDGGPDVVVEIQSPHDETDEKLPFYAEIGVREIWVIDRDTKEPVIYTVQDRRPVKQSPGVDGWWSSPAAGLLMRPTGQGKLTVQLQDDETTRGEVP